MTPITPASNPPKSSATTNGRPNFCVRIADDISADRHESGLPERHLAGLEGNKETIGRNDIDAGEDKNRLRVTVDQTVEHRARYLCSAVRVPNRPVGR